MLFSYNGVTNEFYHGLNSCQYCSWGYQNAAVIRPCKPDFPSGRTVTEGGNWYSKFIITQTSTIIARTRILPFSTAETDLRKMVYYKDKRQEKNSIIRFADQCLFSAKIL